MSFISRNLSRSRLPAFLVLCVSLVAATSVYAEQVHRPLLLEIIGDPDAAVDGTFTVGSASSGSKALNVVGTIDFLGIGTVHNYFTQGPGNNMQINTNVDDFNTVGDASKSQWKAMLGSDLDQFSIRRSPAGSTYNEDALFFIDGSTGQVGIAVVDTGNSKVIPFTPDAHLHVDTPTGDAIWGVTSDSTDDAAGVFGMNDATTGATAGVWGETASPDGSGVFGFSTSTTGTTSGVLGSSDSTDGNGVIGLASATTGQAWGVGGLSDAASGTGVMGWATSTTGSTDGVFGQADSPDGTGVVGLASTTTGSNFGVRGQSDSTSGEGVQGFASRTAGNTFGVEGQAASTGGVGVLGWATASTGNTLGIWGLSDSTTGIGVVGHASTTTGVNVGVYGETDSLTDGWAGFFVGDVNINGTLFKSAGGFKIDHPLDPTSMYLNHSFVESPEMKNLYDGVVSLDANGEAWVQLPAWFEALNKDFRYQLTSIGAAMPNLHIARVIEDGQFKIAGGAPGTQVSWQVTGIRHDSYAEANRIPVEEEKAPDRLQSFSSGGGYGRSADREPISPLPALESPEERFSHAR